MPAGLEGFLLVVDEAGEDDESDKNLTRSLHRTFLTWIA